MNKELIDKIDTELNIGKMKTYIPKKISKKYKKRLANGKRIEVGIYIKTERPFELKETLTFIGQSSRNFYLHVGNYINSKLS